MKITEIKNLEELVLKVEETNRFSELIRLKCYECSNYQLTEVRNCDVTTCPLWKVRTGKRCKNKIINTI